MPSNLPSSISRYGAQQPPKYSPQPEEKPPKEDIDLAQAGNLPLIVSVVALLLAIAAFFVAYTGEKPLSSMQKEQVRGVIVQLKALQNKDLTVTAPFSTTIRVNMSYPTKKLFPDQFEIPLQFDIPLDTRLIGISPTGQTVSFKVQENVPVSANIPVSSEKAFGTSTIKIEGDVPVDTVLYSTVQIRSAYRQELNGMIESLEALAGDRPSGE